MNVNFQVMTEPRQNVKTIERRRNGRIKVHFFTVARRIVKSKQLCQPHIGMTRDISADGMYFYTRMKMKRGDLLALAVHVISDGPPGRILPKLEGTGEILRIERIGAGLPLAQLKGVAVQFSCELAVSF
jgi:hypothetical protein